jgi:hypothetical protein
MTMSRLVLTKGPRCQSPNTCSRAAQLVEDVIQVILDGAHADAQFIGDLCIAPACGDQRQNRLTWAV